MPTDTWRKKESLAPRHTRNTPDRGRHEVYAGGTDAQQDAPPTGINDLINSSTCHV